jgi:hypothetical protein
LENGTLRLSRVLDNGWGRIRGRKGKNQGKKKNEVV